MKDELLENYIVVYIEKEIANKFNMEMIMNEFTL